MLKASWIPQDMLKFVNYPSRFDNRECAQALKGSGNETTIAEVRKSVETLCARFPLYALLLTPATA